MHQNILDKKPRGKPHFLLFPIDALAAWWEVSEYGNKKYGNRDTWKHPVTDHLESYHEYMNACHRHLMHAASDESIDGESGLPHIFHALWNAAAAVWHYMRIGKESKKHLIPFPQDVNLIYTKGRPNPPE